MVELSQPWLSPPPPCPLPKICKKRVLIAAVFSIFFQFDDNWLILQGGDNKKQQQQKKRDNNIIEEEKRVLHKPKSLLCFSRSPSKTRQSSNAYKKNFQKRKTMSQHIIFFFAKVAHWWIQRWITGLCPLRFSLKFSVEGELKEVGNIGNFRP